MRRLLLNFFKVVFVVSILAQEPLPLSGQVPTQDKRRNWNCLKPYMASSFRKHNELKRLVNMKAYWKSSLIFLLLTSWPCDRNWDAVIYRRRYMLSFTGSKCSQHYIINTQ
ncbi:uncharacterized protein LOC125217823 isoform X2 [Salvia hispanica]|uniref:uncharacterized protein LOC125217823 isoform X2 n=1 Tax=Salvia hispanica TaxID=49212 RepID=UPI00200913D0|nr:uncharacterized protein LOC125217823 isoform X2 [Salvia hispanica]